MRTLSSLLWAQMLEVMWMWMSRCLLCVLISWGELTVCKMGAIDEWLMPQLSQRHHQLTKAKYELFRHHSSKHLKREVVPIFHNTKIIETEPFIASFPPLLHTRRLCKRILFLTTGCVVILLHRQCLTCCHRKNTQDQWCNDLDRTWKKTIISCLNCA